MIYADPQPATAPTGVAQGTCFRQVEYAGLLSNAGNPEGGKALLDFMLSKQFQEDLPLNMFVYPVRKDAAIPESFRKFGPPAEKPGPWTRRRSPTTATSGSSRGPRS